ncbi:MAG: TrpR-like protein, YerC/YecD [Clostridia bacterium]|jgi:TrpR-related protein YerC/YecD|nr:TrpR-like protein, YerC/YecD [Clostridia bacterium]
MQNNLRDKHMDQLFQAILKLEDLDQCYALFSDLCTVTELLSMKQRFWVARLLKEGYIYSDIVEITGASTATISRVNRCLQYGDGGYSLALDNKDAGAE